MIVISHQAEGAYPDVPQTGGFPQQGDKNQLIRIVIVDPLATTATIHHVVPGAWKYYP
ncbi:MAG TPA: hypothetical protein VEF34_01225 [Syntrophobacteraceae bacterium]|nr:hypothetical protein [Syntrophobacteraceae bacterium]